MAGVDENKVLTDMAKQVSAFANSGGGRIIYGIANDGKVDNGGISRILKGRQNTKEWIEDVLPTLTEFPVLGIDVYEILFSRFKFRRKSTFHYSHTSIPNTYKPLLWRIRCFSLSFAPEQIKFQFVGIPLPGLHETLHQHDVPECHMHGLCSGFCAESFHRFIHQPDVYPY